MKHLVEGQRAYHQIGSTVIKVTITEVKGEDVYARTDFGASKKISFYGKLFPGDYNGLMAANRAALASFDANTRRLLEDHVGEVKRDERLDTTDTQLEVTGRKYAVTKEVA